MSTTPTEVRTTIHGVALALYPGDASWPIQIQRAPDDNGSPDEANATVIAILGAGERTYVDIRSGGTWHYRARHKRAGAVPGVWTVWVGATPKQIPADLPQLPGPDGRYDLSRVRETARTATSITIDWDVGSKVHHVHVFQAFSDTPTADPWPAAKDHVISYSRSATSHTFDLQSDKPFSYAYLQPEAENGKNGEVWKKVLQSAEPTTIATVVTFDPSGDAVVSAAAGEDSVAIYINVGNGSAPADPTKTTFDAKISSDEGQVDTDVHVDTGNYAFVKLVAEDSAGSLGAVTTVKQRREMGAFHSDQTTRSHTGDTNETTLETFKIPGGKLGTDAALEMKFFFDLIGTNGTKTLRVKYGGSVIRSYVATATADSGVRWDFFTFNITPASQQRTRATLLSPDLSNGVVNTTSDVNVDSTVDQDITVTVELANGADEVQLLGSFAKYAGAP